MDGDDEDFPKQGGEALEIGDDFDSEEEADEMPPNPKDAMRQPMKGQPAMQKQPMKANVQASSKATGAQPKVSDVKGKQVED